METLIDMVPVGIWVSQDPQCNHIVGNQAANRLYEALDHENVSASVSPKRRFFRDGQELKPEELPMQEAVAKNIDIRDAQVDVLLPSGTWRNMFGSASPLYDAKGRVRGCIGAFMDITARKQAEEALRESKERYHRFFEDDLTGDYISTPEGRILLCNPAFAEMFGFSSAQEAIGTSILDLYPDPGERESLLERLKQEGKIGRLEVWRKRRDGEPIHIVENLVGHFNDQGQLYEIKGYLFEDTDRKRAEEALREARDELEIRVQERTVELRKAMDLVQAERQRFQNLLDQLPAYLVLLSPDFRVPFANRFFEQRFGKCEGRRCYEYLFQRPEPCENCKAYNVLETNVPQHWEWIGPDGRDYEIYDFPFTDADGSPLIMEVGLDITERKQAEKALRESEQRLKLAQQIARVGTFDWDIRTGVNVWTPELEAMYGLPPGGFAKTEAAWEQLVHPEDRAETLRLVEQAFETGEPMEGQWRVIWPDAGVHWLAGRWQVLKDESGKPFRMTGVNIDITERKNAEAELQRFNDELKQRTVELKHRARQLQKLTLDMSEAEDRERKRLAEILHDDLQQVLASAKFHLSLMRNGVRDDPALHDIGDQIDQMLRDAIAKSRSLSHELSPAVLYHGNFGETLEWLANHVQAKHGLLVHVHTHDQVSVESETTKAFLYKVTQELLFNVVKHARVNEARIQVRRLGRCIYLSISDQGRGFDPEELGQTAGFGLLSIHERIKLLGGCMKIKSAKDKGSMFLIAVPDGEVEPELTGRAPSADTDRLRVLLADDHEIVREGLALLLNEESSVEVIGGASNGLEAVDLADRLKPDVVIMDVSMPLMSGDEATRRIKRHLPSTRVVALSMSEDPDTVKRMHAAGAEAYVLKTAPSEELLAAIRGD